MTFHQPTIQTGDNPHATSIIFGIVSGFLLSDKLGSPQMNPRRTFFERYLKVIRVVIAKIKVILVYSKQQISILVLRFYRKRASQSSLLLEQASF